MQTCLFNKTYLSLSIAVFLLFSFVLPVASISAINTNGIIRNIQRDSVISIQDEIDAASPGDTIFIPSGTYNENIVIDKSLNLVGEDKLFVEDIIRGYLVDYDSNNVYDTFYNLKNGKETDMEVYGSRYWINTDADEDWEFVYNLEDKTVVEWSEKEEEYVTETSSSGGFLGGFGEFFASDAFKFIPIALAAIIVVVIETGLVVLMKRKGFFKN